MISSPEMVQEQKLFYETIVLKKGHQSAKDVKEEIAPSAAAVKEEVDSDFRV